jgi:hypothetical protein
MKRATGGNQRQRGAEATKIGSDEPLRRRQAVRDLVILVYPLSAVR